MTWSLVVKGGLVVDSSQGLHQVADVAISGEVIAEVGANLDAARAEGVIDATGMLVTAGFIDLHAHAFASSVGTGRPPVVAADPTCLAKGVTTLLDAGSAIPRDFPFFRDIDINRDQTRIFALLRIPDPAGPEATTVQETCEVYARYSDVLVGIKYHHSQGYQSLVVAREAADFCGGLLMAESYGPPIPHLLEYLQPGDVLTHAFHPEFRTSLFDHKGKIFPAVHEAIERGVYLDVGFGQRSFGFRTMERALAQGLLPHTISTDLHQGNLDGPVFDMPTTMSKFLALGLSLDQVIERSTSIPARVLKREGQIGTLQSGAIADVVVSELLEGDFVYMDSLQEERHGGQKLEPRTVITRGKIYDGPVHQHGEMRHRVQGPPAYLAAGRRQRDGD